MSQKGVLLLNLGSPEALTVPAVREFLNEFLMDGRVIDLPFIGRRLLVSLLLINRPKVKVEEYRSIWTDDGSPLIATSRRVQAKLQEHFDFPVELAMNYAKPDIAGALKRLQEAGVEELFIMPLYPHYAMSSYETVVVKTMKQINEMGHPFRTSLLEPFYADADYIDALFTLAKPDLDAGFDHLLFTFHGIPERHLRKSDPSHEHCMVTPDCCATCHPAHATCYRHQCLRTAKAFVEKAGIPDDKYSVAFQSRLGRDPWLEPYTDQTLARYGSKGFGKLLMISPSFVTDCLETMEEIAIAGRETYQAAGGKEFKLIPCLNEHPAWIGFLEGRVRNWMDAAVERKIGQLAS
jgi:ferrochelatase